MEFLNPLAFLLLFGILITFLKNKKFNFNEKLIKKVKFGRKKRFFIYLTAFIMFVIALARPVINNKEEKIPIPKKDLVIILDASKEMKCKDIYPNRFKAGIEKLNNLFQNLKLQNVSIIISDKLPYLLNPPSNDYDSIIYLLKHINTHNLFQSTISNIDNAIQTAKKDFPNSIIIVFSATNPKEKVIFYNLSLKPCVLDGNFYPKSSEGINFTYSHEDIKELIKIINSKNQEKFITIKRKKELFYYFLIIGLILVFIATIRIKKWNY